MARWICDMLVWALLLIACCSPCRSVRTPVPPQAPKSVQARVVFGGDVMQHMPQVISARRGKAFDYGPVFAALAERFRRADLVVVNLETTLSYSEPYTGYPMFRSPAELSNALRNAGVDVAVLANNHCCDGGLQGVRTTLEALAASGIKHTGVFADSIDYRLNNPLYLQCRGIRMALLNYTYGTNGMPVPAKTVVNLIDSVRMASDLASARRAAVDCIAVCMHWGDEYMRHENASQRALAAFLRRHGADLVIGSHPHVIQPYAADSASVVVYSLGNLVSNQRKRYCDGGLLAEITLTRHPDGRMEYALEPVPVWVALPAYRILPPEAADTMPLGPAYRTFRADTEALLGCERLSGSAL